jgi:hypothetical protein
MKKLFLFTAILSIYGVHLMNAQGKFSGYMFGDYYYNLYSPSNTASFQAFQLRRVYFTYDNDISEKFTSRFRLEADQSANASNGTIGVAVKDAYLKWKNIFPGSDLLFGIQPTPAFDVSESVWGYRSLEKTIMDLRSIVGSRDIGISLKGNLVEDGMASYWVMLANGNSNKPENDKYKRYYASIQVKPLPGLQATAHMDYKDQSDIADIYHGGNKVSNGQWTTSLFVGYSQNGLFSIGAEGFLQSLSNGYNNGTLLTTKSTTGISVFASYYILPELSAVGRYDFYDPNTDSNAKGDVTNLMVLGLSWKVDKNVAIQPNLWYESYEKPVNGSKPDPLMTTRITFFYTFL